MGSKIELSEHDIIQMMREEWDRKVAMLTEDLDSEYTAPDGEKENLLSKGLKLKHKDSGLLYTVDSISPKDVTLRSPQNKIFTINNDVLEKEYVLEGRKRGCK